jgi:Rrf2 family nitric oxide-sensitive transcriptional repressor
MIRIGDVIRLTEPDFAVVECFATGNQCVLTGSCKLSSMFGDAIASFHSILDLYTLADVALMPQDFLGRPSPPQVSGVAQSGG